MVTILKKDHTRMRVKEIRLPESSSPLLGTGIDVMTLPEGHLSCPKCAKHCFECWVVLDSHRLEMGCMGCGYSIRMLFPLDVDLLAFGGSGRFTCKKHPNRGMIFQHNMDVVCVGCEKCYTQVLIQLRKAQGLVLADA